MNNIIYALESPHDGKVYYVGQSISLHRPYAHIKSTHNKALAEWLRTLSGTNVEPVVRILEREVEDYIIYEREQYWINTMLQRKEPLFNIQLPNPRQLRYIDYNVGNFIKEKRKELGFSQTEFARKAGLGIRFVRELEQGKESLKMDKVLHALQMFGATLIPIVKH